MKRLPCRIEETELVDRASRWLDRLEVALDRVPGMSATHPQAKTLQRLDGDVSAWRRAVTKGYHTPASAAAVQRIGRLLLTLDACERGCLRGEITRAVIR
jgi:hypothetical protein